MHLLTRRVSPAIVAAALMGIAGLSSGVADETVEPLAFGRAADPGEVIPVSLTFLIANPTALNGRRVRVAGVLLFQFESDSLYLNHESYAHRVAEDGLGLDLQEAQDHLNLRRNREKELSGRFVTVEGIFSGTLPRPPCGGPPCIVVRRGFDSGISDINYLEVRPGP